MSPSRTNPAEFLGGKSSEAHLGLLAQGLPQWSLSHVWPHLLLTSSSSWVWRRRLPYQRLFPIFSPKMGCPHLCTGGCLESCSPPNPHPPWSSPTKRRTVIQLSGKCFQNELQVSFHKGEGETLRGCNLGLGNVFLKGACVPWKQSPKAQFQLISAKLATANELCNCQ